MPDDGREIEELRAELAALRQEVVALRARVGSPDAGMPAAPLPRRHLLRAAGAAAVGGVVASVAGHPAPAGATTGDGMILGQLNQADAETGLDAGVATFGVDVETAATTGVAIRGTATAETGATTGVRGVTDSVDGRGVQGIASQPVGATIGVFGTVESAEGTGVLGQAQLDHGVSYGLRGQNPSPDGYAVFSEGRAKVEGDLQVTGLTRMREASAWRLRLVPRGRPPEGEPGQLVVDKRHRLWFSRGGTDWVQLA